MKTAIKTIHHAAHCAYTRRPLRDIQYFTIDAPTLEEAKRWARTEIENGFDFHSGSFDRGIQSWRFELCVPPSPEPCTRCIAARAARALTAGEGA